MNQEIKARIETIKRGEVPAGYKKNYNGKGIIPNEWEETTYKKCLKICSGKDQKEVICENGIYPILGTGGEFGRTNSFLYDKASVLIGRKGTIDKPQYMDSPFWTVDTLFYSEIFENCIPKFIYYNFLLVNWYKYNEASGVPSLSSSTIHSLRTLLPPLHEQQKIADILTTQDRAIELKEQLIAKKQQQKKWLMQNLLTGKKRLRGFGGEWKKVKLGDYLFENSIRNKELKILRVLSVSNKNGFINQGEQFGKSVASKDLSNYKIIENGTIAYNPSRINVGSIALFKENDIGIVSPLYVVMKCKKELLSEFFMFFTETDIFFEKMKALISGGVRDTLNFKDLCDMKITLPPLPEQTAIAEILSTADREIELLQKDLAQEKQKKKALMQLLLTGIVRV